MVETVISIISPIAVNVLSSELYDRKTSLIEKSTIEKSKRKIDVWIKQYISTKDGTVLVSGGFVDYIKYCHPLERIFEHLITDSEYDDHEFVNRLYNECLDIIGKTINIQDQLLIKEFFFKVIEQYKAIVRDSDELCKKSQYVEIEKINHDVSELRRKASQVATKKDVELLKKTLTSKIDNPLFEEELFLQIKQQFYKGNIETIKAIQPWLYGRNNNIEVSVRVMLSLICDEIHTDIPKLLSLITNEKIRHTLVRYCILNFLSNAKIIQELSTVGIDKVLVEICKDIIQEAWDSFVIIEKASDNDSLFFMSAKIVNKYPSEKWLTTRIGLMHIINQNIAIAQGSLTSLLSEDIFVEKIIIYSNLVKTIINITESEVSKQLITVLRECEKMEHIVVLLRTQLRQLFYTAKLGCMFLLQDKRLSSEFGQLEEVLAKNKDIAFINMQNNIRINDYTLDQLLAECVSINQYKPLAEYIISKNVSADEVYRFLDSNKFIIRQDFSIFSIYVQTLQICNKMDLLGTAFTDYKQFDDILGYWILKYEYLGDGSPVELFERFKMGRFKIGGLNDFIFLADVLLKAKMYENALYVLDKIEFVYRESYQSARRKIQCYMALERQIDAYELSTKLIRNHASDEYLIWVTLLTSINCNRDIDASILDIACHSKRPEILSAVSSVYERENQHINALSFAIKALLLSHTPAPSLWGRFAAIMLHVTRDVSDNKQGLISETSGINDLIFAHCADETIVFGILEDGYLDEFPYQWRNILFFSQELSIINSLYRKRIGDIVIYNKKNYTIDRIEPLEKMLFQNALDVLESACLIKIFRFPEEELGNEDCANKFVEWMKKSIPATNKDLLKEYQDNNHFPPATLFCLSRTVNTEYSQFVHLIINDSSYMIRNVIVDSVTSGDAYVLTLSSLVLLYEMDMPFSCFERFNITISEAVLKQIEVDADEIIKSNSRDTVTRLNVIDDHLISYEANEDEKQDSMVKAVEMKKYAQGFQIQSSIADNNIGGISVDKLKKIYGLPDYDTFMVASMEERIVVSVEHLTTILGYIENSKIKTISFVDFLVSLEIEAISFIDYLIKLIKFKYNVFLTESAIVYISNAYAESDNVEYKERLLEHWLKLLYSGSDIEEGGFKEVFIALLQYLLRKLHEKQIVLDSIMYFHIATALLKYKEITLEDILQIDP